MDINYRKKNMKDIYEFSLTKDFIFLANNCGKIYIVISGIIILISLTLGKDSINIHNTFYVVGILGVLTYFARLLLKRFTYKIIINFKNKKITFFMCQGKGELTTSFKETIIRINAYVIFIV